MLKSSVVSYPDRGNYGNSRYRGNCTGHTGLRLEVLANDD